jgi:hypothetical protein
MANASEYLVHEPTNNSILIGYLIGSGEHQGRRLDVVGSGDTIRFSLQGIDGHVDLNLTVFAEAACEMLVGKEAN